MSASVLPAGATFADNGDGTGTFDWTPTFTDVGVYNVKFVTNFNYVEKIVPEP